VSLSYTKLVGRDASFQLIRTNPKLTSNMKLVVDGADNLYLNSIPADPELAKDQYQRYAVDVTKSHEFNVFNFYNKGKTPSKIAYRIGSTITSSVTARDLKNQFDFDFYTSGAKYLKSKQYSEKFSYFAPLYLNRLIPDTFVIFKIKGASNYIAGDQLNQDSSETIKFANGLTAKDIAQYLEDPSKVQFRRDFFKNFQLVKAFDLSPETKIGAYLERIIENPMFPTSPLAINFNPKGYSYYRGLSIKSGTYVELPVDTNSVLTKALPLLKKEQYIVSGFETNNIIHPNILNLEFVFDDDTAEDFEFNRYFGVYCNRIELADFDLDLDATFDNPNDNNQALTIRYKNDDDIAIPVSNSNGVKIRAKNLSSQVNDLQNSMTNDKNLFFTYVETKSDIHLVKSFTWNQQNKFADFRIDDSEIDLGTFFGPGELFSQEPATTSTLPGRSTLAIKVQSQVANMSSFKLYHSNGTHADSAGEFDPISFVLSSAATGGSFAFNEPGVWSVQYLASGESVIYVSGDGSTQDIAIALAGAINSFAQSDIQAVAVGQYVFVQIKEFGESLGQLKAYSQNSSLKLIGLAVDGFIYADGGTTNPYPIIDNGQITEDSNPLIKIDEIKDQLLVKTKINWSKISRVARPTALISPLQSVETLERGTDDFLSRATIILKDNEQPYIAHGNIEIRKISKNKVGVLSIFDIKDFDFGITKTDYARFDKIDLFKDFYEPAYIPTLDFRKYVYKCVGKGKVLINDETYQENDYIWQDKNGLQLYELVEGDCALIKTAISPNTFLNLTVPEPENYLDLATVATDDEELKNYTGQFSLRTPALTQFDTAETANSEIAEYRNRYIQGILDSEYLLYGETGSIEFALDNKLTPYIAKWGLKDSIDSRSNPYRLNADLVFGKDNLGPSHTETLPISEKLTHEWFYIESDFGFNQVPETMFQNYSYFEEHFNIANFINDPNYFDDYFNYVPAVNSEQIDRVQLRYSDLFRDPYSGQYETVFKGVKYRFFELDQARLAQDSAIVDSFKAETDRFKDYRFSALLVPYEDNVNSLIPPATFEIVENTNAKAIIVLIYIAISPANTLIADSKFRDQSLLPKRFSQAELMSIAPSGQVLFTELYGDYRVNFKGAVSNLTHSFLYYAKSKKYNSGDESFSTTRLAKNIDFSFSGFVSYPDANNSSTTSLEIPLGLNYEAPLESQLAVVQEQYSPIVMVKPVGQNFLGQMLVISTSETDLVSVADNPILKVEQETVYYTDDQMYLIEILPNGGVLAQSPISELPTGTKDQWLTLYYTYQINGGLNYYEKLFQYISFANFKFLLDTKEEVINWRSYTNGALAATRQFSMRAIDSTPVTLTTSVINIKEAVTANSKSVTGGYSYSEATSVPIEIHRYSGEYDVIFKPVSAFYQSLQINDFTINGANCALHIHVPGVFELPEFYHVKYSKSQLLDLENSTKYSPVYPLIGETPIAYANYNILSSSWDKGYHFEYLDKQTYSRIFGTRRLTEDYSFVSKLINVPETLHLDEFYISQVTQAQFRALDFSNMVEYADYAKNIRFKVDFARATAVGFKNKGLYSEFSKFFKDSNGDTITSSIDLLGELTLAEYTEQYAKLNLQSLYKVDEVEIWQKFDKTIPNGTVILVSKTLDQFIAEGYSQTKNVRINNQNPTVLEGSIDKPINSGVYVGFRIKIKFI
jgi:hypothetical protein